MSDRKRKHQPATVELRQVDEFVWEIPRRGGMRVPGRIFANEALMRDIEADKCLQQVANVAHLPGIVSASLAMPDIHWGYGFPIGGVAATDPDDGGVISPGGVGYDINCGVRVLATNLSEDDIRGRTGDLMVRVVVETPKNLTASFLTTMPRSRRPNRTPMLMTVHQPKNVASVSIEFTIWCSVSTLGV